MSGNHRRCGDSDGDDLAHDRLVNGDKWAVLDYIHGYYKEALDRLPVEEMPVLLKRLLKAGVCFGPLDPISNIIANTISYRPPHTNNTMNKNLMSIMNSKKRKRGVREITVSHIAKKTESTIFVRPLLPASVCYFREPNKMSKMGIVRRSLEGLIAFLVCYFPYLPVVEALRYLRMAKADLLVAVHLIELDRFMASFSITFPTARTALKCAALAAWHPKPDVFVTRSLSLSSHLDMASELMAREHRLSRATVEHLYGMLVHAPVELMGMPEPMEIACSRFHYKKNKEEDVPTEYTVSLKRVLLDKIHGFYLMAIARLSRDALCTRYHRGLLKAGHCCGPLDPVSNIVLNTIWYDTAFRARREFKVDMISTKSLMRMECCSLNALVAFLCTRFRGLSHHEAIYYLLLSNANLKTAIKIMLRDDYVFCNSPCHAFAAAAVAANHPNPVEQAEFAMSYLSMSEFSVQSLLCAGHALSSANVQLLSLSVSSTSPSPGRPVQPVEKLKRKVSWTISANKKKFEAQQSRVCRKVKAALHKYALQNGELEYELHVICCVNENVGDCGGPVYRRRRNLGSRSKYQYSHFNFWASPKGEAPQLFFVECSNDDEDKEDVSSLCCPVPLSSTDVVRCFYCELQGIRTVHPALHNYHGRDRDFEEMAGGNYRICNELIVHYGDLINIVGISEEEDSIYFDPDRDAKFAHFMNHWAEEDERGNWRTR